MCDKPNKRLQTIAESLNSMDEGTGYFMPHLTYDDIHSGGESSDLELAAEIGKALLERNRELEILVKTTQEFAEEEANQSMQLARQVEVLRESNESKSRLCQQLDLQFQELSEKYAKLKVENCTLQGRYRKAYDTSEALEKKCEDLKEELERLTEEHLKVTSDNADFHVIDGVRVGNIFSEERIEQHENGYSSPFGEDRHEELEAMKDELDSVYKSFLESQEKLECEKRHREDLECELNDLLHEKELLQQRTVELENEILEWQDVAQRAEQYQKLADKYCSGWDLSSEDSSYTVLTFDTKLINVGKDKNVVGREAPRNLCTSHTHEHVSLDRDATPTNDAGEQQNEKLENHQHSGGGKLSSTPDPRDVRLNNLSLLSELDVQYNEMVKRYEALLEKCKNEGKITDDPVRTKKVQRAIQTLSLDLSYISSPLSPSSKTFDKEGKCPRCNSTGGSKLHLGEGNENMLDTTFDYRMMFAEIFSKLKESKDFDPVQQTVGGERG